MTAPLLDVDARRHVLDARLVLEDATDHRVGDVTVLFGPSGSGKTTLLRCLAGLEPLDDGGIAFRGESWNAGPRIVVPARARRVGLLFQDHALFPHLGIEANVVYGLGGMPRRERGAAVQAALRAAHADHLVDRTVPQLSGGEAQRVALARALAPGPGLLLLDEPLSALDAATRASLRTELRRILVEQRIPTVLVTHDRAEALALADRIVVLVDGSVRQVGTPVQVFDRPTDPVVARVVGVETAQPATVRSVADGVARIDVAGRPVSAAVGPDAPAPGDEVLVCIRAEDVSLQLAHTDAISSQRNQLDAVVTSVATDGPLVRVDLDAGFRLTSYITRPACEDLEVAPGSRLVAVFKGQAVHLIRR